MNAKTKGILNWVLTGLIAAVFIMSAVMKLSGAEEVVNSFKAMGLGDNARIGIGLAELISIILFIIPRTGVLGTVLLIGYMGGTIMAHVAQGIPFYTNILIGIAIGVVGYLRFPELGSRLFKKA